VSVKLKQDRVGLMMTGPEARMRTYLFYGLLALGGCASPQAAFPDLGALEQPAAPASGPEAWAAAKAAIESDGAAARAAGERLRAGGY